MAGIRHDPAHLPADLRAGGVNRQEDAATKAELTGQSIAAVPYMREHRRFSVGVALLSIAGSITCTAPARSSSTPGSDTTLECAAGDIHHTFRIRADDHLVEDVSFSPAKAGRADVSATEYRLLFQEPRDHYELMVRIDRATGTGTRRLFDDEQQLVKGHGGTDDITCAERR